METKLITVKIIEEALSMFLTAGNLVPEVFVSEGIPSDARLVSANVNDGMLELLFSSESIESDREIAIAWTVDKESIQEAKGQVGSN